MHRGLWLLLGSAALLAVLIMFPLKSRNAAAPEGGAPSGESLLVYCAVGVRPPVEAAANAYQQETGVSVQLQYGASQPLLTGAETSGKGDLYIPADESYVTGAAKKGETGATVALATMRGVLLVAKGNPLNIHALADLLRPDVHVAQANPDAAAMGRLTRTALSHDDTWEQLRTHTKVFTATVSDAATAVNLGTADVAIVWDAIVGQYAHCEAVQIPQLHAIEAHILAGVLTTSEHPQRALRFAQYLADPARGGREFTARGYGSAE